MKKTEELLVGVYATYLREMGQPLLNGGSAASGTRLSGTSEQNKLQYGIYTATKLHPEGKMDN